MYTGVGTIAYTNSCVHSNYISAGECQLYTTPKDTIIQISNPYEEELVNFLQIWLHASGIDPDNAPQTIAFNIINDNNQVVPMPVKHPSRSIHYKSS